MVDSKIAGLTIQPLGDQPLKLTNKDGKLEIFFIGTGSAFAATLFQTNFLIIQGQTHILVDFGTTGQLALLQIAGLKPTDIGVLFPTHSHADHVGGIECLGLMNRYVGRMGKPRIKMIITKEYQRILWGRTLRGGMEWNEKERETGRKLSFSDYFKAVRPVLKTRQPREIFEVNYGGIQLEIFRTKHIPDSADSWEASFVSYGLLVNGRVFMSCDTRFDRDLISLYVDRSAVIFHDAQFFPGGVHASLAELKTLPPEIKAKMFLMHYGDNWREQDTGDFAGLAQQGVRYIFE